MGSVGIASDMPEITYRPTSTNIAVPKCRPMLELTRKPCFRKGDVTARCALYVDALNNFG